MHCDSRIDSASNENEYQEYFLAGKGGRCVGLITLTHSCADCLKIWKPQTPGTLRVCPGMYRDCVNIFYCTTSLYRVQHMCSCG
jgi:hypothetical protein